ncbi:MAG: hypothetical protein ACR2PZ_24580 [Pseudomonadales bacterium]
MKENSKIVLALVGGFILGITVASEFGLDEAQGYQHTTGYEPGYGPAQQCPPGTLPAVGPGAQQGACAPVTTGGPGYNNGPNTPPQPGPGGYGQPGNAYGPNGQFSNNQQPGAFGQPTGLQPAGEWGPNTGGGQYNPNVGGGQYNPNVTGYQYGPNGPAGAGGNSMSSGEVDLGEATEADGW